MAGSLTAPLAAAILVSGALAILGEERGPRWLVYVWKPTTTLLILVSAALVAGAPPRYQIPILAGLAASCAGDVFLMLPRDRFLAGLVSFLGAHVAYLVAFAVVPSGWAPWVALVILLGFGGGMVRVLWPGLGALRGPVVAYVSVILAMAWMAVARWQATPGPATAAAALGALLFVASDTLLALDRFRGRFPAARALVLTTYYAAQCLIAWSVRGEG